MPLAKGHSRATISKNIAELRRAGHPADQAAAIAYKTAREHADLYADLTKFCGGEGGKPGPCPNEHIGHVVEGVKQHGGAYNHAPIHKVREHLHEKGIREREHQDKAIQAARRAGKVGASALEGRGLSPAERALHTQHVLREGDELLSHLHLKGDNYAELFSDIVRLCDHGPNEGKPGVCPGEKSGAEKTASSGKSAHQQKLHEAHGAFQQARQEALKHLNSQAQEKLADYTKHHKGIVDVHNNIDMGEEGSDHAEAYLQLDEAVVELPNLTGVRDRFFQLGDVIDRAQYFREVADDKASKDAAKKIIDQAKEARQALRAYAQKRKAIAEVRRGKLPQHDFAEKFSEGNNRLSNVEIFATGTHRGKNYSHRDLDDMERNFKRFSTGQKPGYSVPAVLGHEETQEFLEREDLPAAAWLESVKNHKYRCPECRGTGTVQAEDGNKERCPRCVGTGTAATLTANMGTIGNKVKKLLDSKAYKTVSAEVYDDPPEGLKGKGKALRRVAFLGGNIPQIKTLDDIPTVESHAEGRGFAAPRFTRLSLSLAQQSQKTAGVWTCFSENRPMERDEMIKHLLGVGYSQEALDKAPDELLAEMCRHEEEEGDEPPPEEPAEDQDADQHDDEQPDEDEPHDMDDDEQPPEEDEGHDPFAEYADDELPEPKDEDEKKEYAERARKYAQHLRKYAHRARKYMEKYCSMNAEGYVPPDSDVPADTSTGGSQPMGDSPVTTETRQPQKTTVTHQFSDKRIAQIVRREVQAALNGSVKKKMDRFEKFTEQQISSQKKVAIEKFCEEMLTAKKITPAELDRDDPSNLFDRLMRADARTVIRKFTEGKKTVALTELDLQMREIRNRQPVRKFSEQARSGKNGAPVEVDIEVEKVETAFERFSDKFPKGATKKDIVEGFKIEKKYHPDVTAEDYLEALVH